MVGVTRFILRHQRAVLAGVIALVGLGVWQRTRLKESQSLQELVVRGDPRRTVFEQMQRDFGDDQVLALAVDVDVDVGAKPVYESAQKRRNYGER